MQRPSSSNDALRVTHKVLDINSVSHRVASLVNHFDLFYDIKAVLALMLCGSTLIHAKQEDLKD